MPGTAGRVSERNGASAAGRGRGDGGVLERVTVNLTARAARALELATKLTGDSKTDTINRALQIYAFLEETSAEGGAIYVREGKGTELERLRIFLR